MEIVITTENLHKIREFREMLKVLPHIDVLSLRDFPDYSLPASVGDSFESNAIAKATHTSKALNKWVLADDSGLIIPALNGAPGIKSRTYAGDDATDAENCQKVLEDLEGKDDLDRAAYLECCVAIAAPDGVKKTFKGICEGEIVTSQRGSNSFGYDAIFRKHDYDKTFSEIDEAVRIRISHRRKAFEKLQLYLETVPQDALV